MEDSAEGGTPINAPVIIIAPRDAGSFDGLLNVEGAAGDAAAAPDRERSNRGSDVSTTFFSMGKQSLHSGTLYSGGNALGAAAGQRSLRDEGSGSGSGGSRGRGDAHSSPRDASNGVAVILTPPTPDAVSGFALTVDGGPVMPLHDQFHDTGQPLPSHASAFSGALAQSQIWEHAPQQHMQLSDAGHRGMSSTANALAPVTPVQDLQQLQQQQGQLPPAQQQQQSTAGSAPTWPTGNSSWLYGGAADSGGTEVCACP